MSAGNRWSCGVVLLAVACAGCGGSGPQRVAVTGTIVDKSGSPVPSGMVTFYPAKGRTGPAATTGFVNGRYEFDDENGPAPGNTRALVRIVTSDKAKAIAALPTENQKTKSAGPLKKAGRDDTGEQVWEYDGSIPDQGSFEWNFQLK